MAQLTFSVDADRVRANLGQVRQEIDRAAVSAGRDPAAVEILAATKYVVPTDLPALAQAGVTLVGENRAQDLAAKAAEFGELFTWDFIGAVQSRRIPLIVPYVRLIHSIATTSALAALERCADSARPGVEVLIQVNVARESGKAGIAPADLPALIASSPVPVAGLCTMPPLASDPDQSRRWFSALRELAHEHGLPRLSMGTTQDYLVAVAEGATTVRIGARLFT